MAKNTLPKETYIELALLVSNPSLELQEFIVEFLKKQRVQPSEIIESFLDSKYQYRFYTRSFRKIEQVKTAFSKSSLKKVRLKTTILGRADWLDKWMLDYHSANLGKKFKVVPLWEKERFNDKKRIPVYMDPKGAFGSGLHETTQLMIALMEKVEGKFNDFFDVGVGTGILSIAAAHLGAQKILGIDYDDIAIRSSHKNLKLNKIKEYELFEASLSEFKRKKKYDLVAANVVSKNLTNQKRKLISFVKKEKYLIVCGIVLENFKVFQEEFKSPMLKCLKVLKGKRWGSCLYQKKA